MTNEEALQWCAEHDVKVCFHDPEKKRQEKGIVTIERNGNTTSTVLGQGSTFLEAVEDVMRIHMSTPERKNLGRVTYESYWHACHAGYDEEEVWRMVGDAVTTHVLEMQRLAVEASE